MPGVRLRHNYPEVLLVKRSTRFVAIAVVAAICAWSLFFELCNVPWILTYPPTGFSMPTAYWVWERPKDIKGGVVYTFDSVGMLKQIGNAAIIVLIAGGLTFLLLRWRGPTEGRCPKCDYDLRGDLSSGCPECGWQREAGA